MLRLSQLIEDHVAKELCTADFCSPLFFTSKQTLRLGQLIEDHVARYIQQDTSVRLFSSFRSERCQSVS